MSSNTRVYRGVLLVAAVVLTVALAGCGASGPEQQSADYQKGYRLGLEAYTYGLPLMVTNATYQTMTSVNVSNGAYGPVNQFNNVRGANNAGSKAVVAPGSTSLSSIAWLDLRDEPQVLHVPEVDGPLLRTGSDRSLHRERQEPGHRQQHEAGRLRDRRSRSARGEDTCGDATTRRRLLAHLDHRVHSAQGAGRRRQRQQDPGRLHVDAPEQVRDGLHAARSLSSGDIGHHVSDAHGCSVLRRARTAARRLPPAGSR